MLSEPFFYFSLYLREYRTDYYDALQRIRTDGDWEGWLRFCLIGVEAVARQAVETAHALRRLFDDDRARVAALGRSAGSALRVYDLLRDRVIVSAPVAAAQLDLTWPTVNAALGRLEDLGIVRETTGRARNRAWIYQRQLELLDAGTRAVV